MTVFRFQRLVLTLSFSLLASQLCFGAKPADKLPAKYRDWLQKDVVYIISADEKEVFLRLPNDETRDKFMEMFWDVRNPTPGAPNNPYKEEHYRRMAYADQFFGHETGTPGWRTEMGRIYIQLGEPKQKGMYIGYNKLRPMQIWFYENANQALPPFFYIIFYRADSTSEYKIYSPYLDGPEKLVTTDPGSRSESLKVIADQAGNEVARTALSLIPDEPVDTTNARASLQSDVMLATIRNLPNNDFTKREIAARRAILESVTHRVILGGESLDANVVPLRDANGEFSLHYILRQRRPEDLSITQAKDGRLYYSLDIAAHVLSGDGKPLFADNRHISKYLAENEAEKIRHQDLAFVGRLPIAPGKYKVLLTLTDAVSKMAFQIEKDVEVARPLSEGIAISALVPFDDSVVASTDAPFTVAGVTFRPMIGDQLNLEPGRSLKVVYQIWAPAANPTSLAGKKLLVEYAYGRLGMRSEPKIIKEEVLRNQFDPFGSLVSGKKIPLTDLPAGNYRLVVTVVDPDTQQKAYANLSFRIASNVLTYRTWYVADSGAEQPPRPGTEEYDRAICYRAAGEKEQAAAWLRKALQQNPGYEPAINVLADLYTDKQEYSQLAALYPAIQITPNIEDSALLEIAESLDKAGDVKRAAELLQSAIRIKNVSSSLYLRLASYYRRLGDERKATELERKVKETPTPPTS